MDTFKVELVLDKVPGIFDELGIATSANKNLALLKVKQLSSIERLEDTDITDVIGLKSSWALLHALIVEGKTGSITSSTDRVVKMSKLPILVPLAVVTPISTHGCWSNGSC